MLTEASRYKRLMKHLKLAEEDAQAIFRSRSGMIAKIEGTNDQFVVSFYFLDGGHLHLGGRIISSGGALRVRSREARYDRLSFRDFPKLKRMHNV